eukprot:scpid66885/ scgid6088/ Fibropellin-1; Epidermal growth factor-related protein 1; Fibropellin-I; SpEGF I; UEGF-1
MSLSLCLSLFVSLSLSLSHHKMAVANLFIATLFAVITAGCLASLPISETTDCLTTLIRLSQIPRNEWDRTEALLRANSADQALFDFSERFDDASSLLRDLGVNRSVDRYKLFTCLHRGASSTSPCRIKSPCGGGLCTLVDTDYLCVCNPGYTGADCRQELNECEIRRPCLNGGTCLDRVNNFTCTCPEGYYGRRCETDRNECASSPCVNGQCIDVVNGFTCECVSGYTGTVCDEDVDECASSPCQHGKCKDRFNAYKCHCAAGYTGIHCETDMDECESSPCQHEGTCRDAVNAYTCFCHLGYDGLNCENKWISRSTFESSRGTTYTRWGRQDCPDGTERVYTGYSAGSYYAHKGGGANILCLHGEPVYGRSASHQWGSPVYGVTYYLSGQSQPYTGASLEGKTVPCTVCLATNRSSTVMIPARNDCPEEWHLEYHGYMMGSPYSSDYRGEHLCFDDAAEGLGPYGSPGHRISPVQIDLPYGLPSVYVDPKEITCSVCTR